MQPLPLSLHGVKAGSVLGTGGGEVGVGWGLYMCRSSSGEIAPMQASLCSTVACQETPLCAPIVPALNAATACPDCAGGGYGLRFEHPTLAGPTVGGWMNRAEGSDGKPQAQVDRLDAAQGLRLEKKKTKTIFLVFIVYS